MLDPPNGNLAIKTFWLVPNSAGGAHGGAVAQRGCPYYQCTPSRLYPAPFPPPAPPAAAPKANAQLPKAKGKLTPRETRGTQSRAELPPPPQRALNASRAARARGEGL